MQKSIVLVALEAQNCSLAPKYNTRRCGGTVCEAIDTKTSSSGLPILCQTMPVCHSSGPESTVHLLLAKAMGILRRMQ